MTTGKTHDNLITGFKPKLVQRNKKNAERAKQTKIHTMMENDISQDQQVV